MSAVTTITNPARVRADQERRRSSAASPHVDRRAQAARGRGRGGRQGARRAAVADYR